MPITYVNFYNGSQFTYESLIPNHRVLFFDPVMERSGRPLFDRWRSLDPALRNAGWLVLRGRTESFVDAMRSDSLLWSILESLRVPVTALVGALPGGTIRLVCDAPFSEPQSLTPLDDFRVCELQSIIRHRGAVFGRHDDVHYELPSGDHVEDFIRLGNALQEETEVARISDWIIPFLSERTAIIADTSALLPLLLTLKLESQRLYGSTPPTRALEGYPEEQSRIQEVVDDAVREIGREGQLLFLISVSASRRLQTAISGLELPIPAKVLVICDTNAEVGGLQTLVFNPIQRWDINSEGKCEECLRRHIVHVDRRTYERLQERNRVPVSIDHRAADRHRLFWEAVDRTNAAILHYDLVEFNSLRHYGIYIDLVALASDPWFREKCLETLHRIGQPTIAIVIDNRAADSMCNLLFQAFGDIEVCRITAGQVSREVSSRLQLLGPEDSVLIVDDGLVTSTTLSNLRSHLHGFFKASRAGIPKIRCFVILARPENDSVLREIKNRFRMEGGSQFHAAYELLMPPRTDCPWCEEAKRIQSALARLTGGGRIYAQSRLQQLQQSLQTSCLLGAEAIDGECKSVGSFFGELGQVTAFVAAAQAIHEQWMIKTEAVGRQRGPSTEHYVDVPALLNNYFADAFAPAVLRTMKILQLTYRGQNEGIYRVVGRLEPRLAFPCIVPELLWAVIQSKLPRSVSQLVLRKIQEPTPAVDMLTQLLEATRLENNRMAKDA